MRNRVKELRTVKASELRQNPKNWRVHPRAQSDALRVMLDQVGFAAAVIARETPDGLELIDGHLRRDIAHDAEIPVLVVDLTDYEADLVLATFDPLSAMAKRNQETLDALLADVRENASDLIQRATAVTHGLEDLRMPQFEPTSGDDQPPLDTRSLVVCPECGHEFHPA